MSDLVNRFISDQIDKFNREPSYAEVVDVAVKEKDQEIEKLKAENADLKFENEKRKSWCEFLESASTAKFREIIERADAIESNTTLDRCSEASHYTWLDDQITKLTRQRDILKKALTDMSASIKWFDEVFMGPEHEFAHWWRVELRGNFIDPALQDVEESENEKAKL